MTGRANAPWGCVKLEEVEESPWIPGGTLGSGVLVKEAGKRFPEGSFRQERCTQWDGFCRLLLSECCR